MGKGRPYLSVHFRCCRVYARVYLNARGNAYAGHCPRCCRKIDIRIDPYGVDDRIFEAN